MATENQPFDDQVNELSAKLCHVSSVMKLCAFAAEARRTLSDIQATARMAPTFEKLLNEFVESNAEWTSHDDMVGIVLRETAYQVDEIKQQLEELRFGHDHHS